MAVRKKMGIPAAAPATPRPRPKRQPEPKAAPAPEPEPEPAAPVRKDPKEYRVGMIQLTVWIPQDAKRQIDIWCARHQRSRQSLVQDALDLFFAKHRMQRIAKPSVDADG